MENDYDVSLFQEKSRFFLGCVKIQISNLDFNHTIQFSEENDVQKLVEVFRGEGCQRLDPWNYIPVIVRRHLLAETLQVAGLSDDDIRREGEPPLLNFSTPLEVLHGRRRLLAGQKYLWDKWWVVELYGDDLPVYLKISMREYYSHSRPFCDGDIYRQVLKYQRQENISEEEKWARRLSHSKFKRLRQLRSKYRHLARSFDLLTPFVGIWYQLHLGCLSRLLPDKTPEEFSHYLQRMLRQYETIMGTEDPFLLDQKTIHLIETLVPNYSSSDADKIRKLMNDHDIFPAVRQEIRRQKILNNILGIDGRILSFHTFLQDTIYFSACSKTLRGLLPTEFKGTVRQGFLSIYQRGLNSERIRILSIRDHLRDLPGREAIHIQIAYRQLFLAAMREFPLLSSLAPLWDSQKRKPLVHGSASEKWHQLASLAYVLGFRAQRITQLMEGGSSNEKMALEFLEKARPPELYSIDETLRNNLMQYIAQHIDEIAAPREIFEQLEYTTNLEGLSKDQRCNRPFESAFKRNRNLLYITNFYDVQITPRAYVTSLFIQRDIFICFLGTMSITDSHSITPHNDGHNDESPPNVSRVYLNDTIPDHTQDGESEFVTANEELPSCSQTEQLLAIEPNTLHDLDSSVSNAEAIRSFQSVNGVMVLYIWDRRQYAKFTNTEEQKIAFDEITCSLADDGYRFITVYQGQILTQILNNLWNIALTTPLIVALPKVDGVDPLKDNVTTDSLEQFFNINNTV